MNIKQLTLLEHTVLHLKRKQIIYQIKNRLSKPKYVYLSVTGVVPLALETPITKYPCLIASSLFFLNIEDRFTDWNDTTHGMLWAYNLNYMDWLGQEDMDYETGARWIDKFINDIDRNQVGLDPYPIALRGINWMKFIARHRKHIEDGKLKRWNDSLYAQYVLLTKKLEFHLLGNHLLEDAYSLFIAAVYFENVQFYEKSVKLLCEELQEQILPDGAHYEQSPMYHCILLDRLLDCCNISFNNIRFDGQKVFNSFLREMATLMLGHLECITYDDGTIPLLNDSANGIAPTPQMLKTYARQLDMNWKKIPLKECGYRKLRAKAMEVVADIGNITATYQPGHTHADTFNYELHVNGQPIICDTGISTYNKNERRQYERSTMAHNTVSVCGKSSSEVWDGFRVGKRAKVTVLRDETNYLEAIHDGYKKPCKRTFRMVDNALMVEDAIAMDAISHIHLWKDEAIESVTDWQIVTTHCIIAIEHARQVKIREECVSTAYNRYHRIKVIDIHFRDKMTYRVTKK